MNVIEPPFSALMASMLAGLKATVSTPLPVGSVVMMLPLWELTTTTTGDGWTAVVPEGLILSGVVVLLLGVSGWLGQSLVYRHRIGVEQ